MPSLFDQIVGYQGDHPKDVAKAYQQLQQQMGRNEGEAEEKQWRDKFAEIRLAGGQASDTYNPETGDSWQAPGLSELERWKGQIDGMITSGNPVLQKQGMSMLGAYQARATAPESRTDSRTMGAKYADELRLQGQDRIDFIRDYSTKSTGTTVNVGDGGKEGQMLSSEEKQKWGLDQDANYAHTKTGPKPIKSTSYTEAQIDSSGYASRMEQAEQTLLALDESGFDATSARQKLGDLAGDASGVILSPTQQIHKQAADTWIRNKLRDESGAAIAEQEMADEYSTYFPQPGESKSVVYAKQLARRMAIRTMADASGGKYVKEDFAEAESLVKMAMEEDKTWKEKQSGIIKKLGGKTVTPGSENMDFTRTE